MNQFTNFNWIHLFHITNGYDLVYKWFIQLGKSDIAGITAFVIMPNHLHFILSFKNDKFYLNKLIAMQSDLWLMK